MYSGEAGLFRSSDQTAPPVIRIEPAKSTVAGGWVVGGLVLGVTELVGTTVEEGVGAIEEVTTVVLSVTGVEDDITVDVDVGWTVSVGSIEDDSVTISEDVVTEDDDSSIVDEVIVIVDVGSIVDVGWADDVDSIIEDEVNSTDDEDGSIDVVGTTDELLGMGDDVSIVDELSIVDVTIGSVDVTTIELLSDTTDEDVMTEVDDGIITELDSIILDELSSMEEDVDDDGSTGVDVM